MNMLLDGLERVARRLELITLDICVLLIVVMCGVLLSELVARNVFATTFLWSLELATTCFVWMAFLGSTVAVRRQEHFSVDLIATWAPPGGRASYILRVLGVIIVAIIGIVLLWKGIPFAQGGMRRFSFSLGIRQGYTMMIMPITGGLILFYALVELLALSLGRASLGVADDLANEESVHV
jgi:TRAP-type transport system small permease protein